MVNKSIQFSSNDFTLEIRENIPGWCSLFLLFKGETIPLGENSPDVIIRRLDLMLNDFEELEEAGELDGEKVYWVLSTEELHYSVYAKPVLPDSLILYFQDAKAQIVAECNLSVASIRDWKRLLREV